MKKFKNILTVLFAVAVVFSSIGASLSVGSEQNEKGGHGYISPIFKILRKLNLSDEQKKGVSDIFKKYRDSQKAGFKTMMAAQENLSKAIYSNEFNESAVREAHKPVAAAGEEMAVLRAKIASEINAVLTPDQRNNFQKLLAARFDKIKQKMGSGEQP